MSAPQSSRTFLDLARDRDARMVDVRVADWRGTWRQVATPVATWTQEQVSQGLVMPVHAIAPGSVGEDGHEASVVIDPATARMDPFEELATIVVVGEVERDGGMNPCVRTILRRVERHVRAVLQLDAIWIGAQIGFHIFDDVRYSLEEHRSHLAVDAVGAAWNSGREEFPNLGHKPTRGPNEDRLMTPPGDLLHGLRSEATLILDELGIEVEQHSTGAGGGAQGELGLANADAFHAADRVMWTKQVIRTLARRRGKVATFMPLPLLGAPGSGLTWRICGRRDGHNAFAEGADPELGRHFSAGLAAHAAALTALTSPSLNGQRRLRQRLQQKLDRNRAAVELRGEVLFSLADPTCSPHLAIAGLLLAGADGVARRLGDSETPPAAVHGDLGRALSALDRDREFFAGSGCLSDAWVSAYIDSKRRAEVERAAITPTPLEFALYFGG